MTEAEPIVFLRGSRQDGRKIGYTRHQVLAHLYQGIIASPPHTRYVSPRRVVLLTHTQDRIQARSTRSC
jgi:hypothetical protein